MSRSSPARGLIALLRLPYWMMTGGLAVLTAFAILKGDFADIPTTLGNLNVGLVALLTFFSMSFIASGGFAINDYYDRVSDAVIKPKRPIPSGALSYKTAAVISGVLFALGLVLSFFINWLSFAIIAVDSILLLVYSYLIKRKSGFAANLLMGVLTGTAFLFGEATMTGTVSLISLSLYPIAFGTIGGNVLRDIFSLEGDAKVGYPTLPQKIGSISAAKVGGVFFLLTGLLAPLPYLIGQFTVYYLPLILAWSALLIYSAIRLFTSATTVAGIRKYERIVTMSMMLLIFALIIEAIVGVLL
ncbi:MAG TPA: UbiA family prenyltransferase [Candidatus Acidoferrales bacterium]|nr:UbiA family prenyltransferase [Candidatus Acidoferrales bacterium]